MFNSPLKDHIFLDIETIPWQAPDALERCKELVKVPGNYSKPETVARYIEENAQATWLKTSLDGTYGEIICATYIFGEGEPVTKLRELEDSEEAFLSQFWEVIGELETIDPIWVGHKVADFDLRFLYHRSVIHGVKPSYRIGPDMKPWAPNIKDTSFMWTGDARGGISLDKLAGALGLRSPKELADGSEVWDMVREGDYQALVEYNRGDTLTTREVYRRLTFA